MLGPAAATSLAKSSSNKTRWGSLRRRCRGPRRRQSASQHSASLSPALHRYGGETVTFEMRLRCLCHTVDCDICVGELVEWRVLLTAYAHVAC